MRHRILLTPGAELEGMGSDQILAQILDQVKGELAAAGR